MAPRIMNAGEPALPQLRMTLDAFDSLPPVALPPGYGITTLREAGVDAWIEALGATGQLGDWDAGRAGEWLSGERRAIPEGTFIVTFDGRSAATCCTIPPTSTERRAELGWLSVSPEHQGRGLGRQVCLAVLHFARQKGYAEIYLNTDDWRLPAVKTYLDLGFRPETTHGSHLRRWDAVYEKLGLAAEPERQETTQC